MLEEEPMKNVWFSLNEYSLVIFSREENANVADAYFASEVEKIMVQPE